MQHGTIAGLLNGIALAGLSFGAFADVQENPYRIITTRNAFGLRAILPQEIVRQPEPAVVPLPEIKLTGITTLSGAAKALIQVEDKQTKRTDFPAPLAVGESYQEITVLAIDVENSTVRIKRGDVEATLDFINHGVKPAVSALASSTIPIPAAPRVAAPPAFATPAGAPPSNRSIVTGGQPYDPNHQRPAQGPRIMSREEVEERIEFEREIRRRNNDPTHKLLPATRREETPYSFPAPATPVVR